MFDLEDFYYFKRDQNYLPFYDLHCFEPEVMYLSEVMYL